MWWGKLGHTHLGVVGVVRPRPPRSDGVVRPRPLGVGERVGEGEVVILIYKTIYIYIFLRSLGVGEEEGEGGGSYPYIQKYMYFFLHSTVPTDYINTTMNMNS